MEAQIHPIDIMLFLLSHYSIRAWGCNNTYVKQWNAITVKPVCNDHLYNKIDFLWLIQ